MNLEDIVAKTQELPPMPAVAAQILEAVNDPDVGMNEFAKMVSSDPGMTTNILKLCNSSFYGFSKAISSVQQATNMLGSKKIAQIAMTVLSSRYLTGAHVGYDLGAGELWKHSIITATAADLIAKNCNYPDLSRAFTAGLLQDIGKIVMATFVEDNRETIMDVASRSENDFIAAEKEIIGHSHAEIGAYLLETWNFPAILVESVRYHHKAELATLDPRLAKISQLANAVTMQIGIGIGADGLNYRISDETAKSLGYKNSEDLENLIIVLAEKIMTSPEALIAPKSN
jgi:putative nucleotidyltransferase with HDIG domain